MMAVVRHRSVLRGETKLAGAQAEACATRGSVARRVQRRCIGTWAGGKSRSLALLGM